MSYGLVLFMYYRAVCLGKSLECCGVFEIVAKLTAISRKLNLISTFFSYFFIRFSLVNTGGSLKLLFLIHGVSESV